MCTPMLLAASLTTAKGETTQMPISGRIDRRKHVINIPQNSIQPSKGHMPTHATAWMDLEDVVLSEISQTQENWNRI